VGLYSANLRKTELYNFSFENMERFTNDVYQMACYFIKKGDSSAGHNLSLKSFSGSHLMVLRPSGRERMAAYHAFYSGCISACGSLA